ncbi:MAG: TetR/AcrR family transcriptional regulator [Acidimicrobiales bacterium]
MARESVRPTHESGLTTRHSRGRHLDSSRDAALRAAALKLLGEIGYDRLTVDKIAALAGAGKATIYRRWSGKAELVVDALTCQKSMLTVPNTGTLRGDLSELARRATNADRQLDTPVMIGLVSALPHDRELRDVFRERLVEPHAATLTEIFQRAERRGEIPPVRDLDTVISILPALVLHRLLTTGTGPDLAFIEHVIEGVVLPLATDNTLAATPTLPLT